MQFDDTKVDDHSDDSLVPLMVTNVIKKIITDDDLICEFINEKDLSDKDADDLVARMIDAVVEDMFWPDVGDIANSERRLIHAQILSDAWKARDVAQEARIPETMAATGRVFERAQYMSDR